MAITQPNNIKRILLIRLRSIGDLMVITPCTRTIKETYPDCHLALAVEQNFKDLFTENPYVDEVIFINRKEASLFGQLKFLYSLNKKNFDMVINLHGGPRSCMMSLASGARYRVGGLQKKHHFNWIFNIRVRPFHQALQRPVEEPIHIVHRHLATLKCAGIEGKTDSLVLENSPLNKQFIENILGARKLRKTPFVAIHCSYSKTVNKISAAKMAQMADAIFEDLSVSIILTGGPQDINFSKKVASKMKHSSINLAGKTTLGQLSALFEKSLLFLGIDSGPAHIAAASGTWVISLFGPTSPTTWRPWTDKRIIIRKENMDCIGCGKKECLFGAETKCLESISPEEIILAIRKNKELLRRLPGQNLNFWKNQRQCCA